MTTDAFETAARAEGRVRADEWMEKNGGPQTNGHHIAHTSIISGFRQGAVWARDHLANQEVTDAEIDAAMTVAAQSMPAAWWGGTEWRRYTEEILTAAKEARA